MFPGIYSDVFEKLCTRMMAYVVFSLEYVLKIASKLENDLSFQHRSSRQGVPMFISSELERPPSVLRTN